jgi:hypothetical protein
LISEQVTWQRNRTTETESAFSATLFRLLLIQVLNQSLGHQQRQTGSVTLTQPIYWLMAQLLIQPQLIRTPRISDEAALSCPHSVCDSVSLQELQEQRMAAIGNPAHKRETLGDKVRPGVLSVPRQLWGTASTFHSVNQIIEQPCKL